jgi:hypothetical protein
MWASSKVHARLLWSLVLLSRIAIPTGCNAIQPSAFSALMLWSYVVNGQVLNPWLRPAILTGHRVSLHDVPTRIGNDVPALTAFAIQYDNFWTANLHVSSLNYMKPVWGQRSPRQKIMQRTIFMINETRLFAKDLGERIANITSFYRVPRSV